MSTGKKSPDNTRHKAEHGGVRPNSGRKKDTLCVTQLQRMLDEDKAMEEETGVSLNQILLNIAHGKKFGKGKNAVTPSIQQRSVAIKMYKEYTMIIPKQTKTAYQEAVPSIWLPDQDSDPAKVVPIDKNTTDDSA